MIDYLRYWRDMVGYALRGSALYLGWLGLLVAGVVVGGLAYSHQLDVGLGVSNLSDQVSWGAYIANFTFLVGVAAAAVLLVVPTYIYGRKDIKQVVLIGELMAVSAMVMCMLFVTVDLGRPDRVLHLAPGVGRLNFPRSILAWDVIVLSIYLLINMHVPGYLLYKRYHSQEPSKRYYLPLVLLSILWAVSIHTVTAFLYSGLGGRPFWNTAILAPRFLVSAFASGPALLLLALSIVRRYGVLPVQESVFQYLSRIIAFALPANFFLLGCELFAEFYMGTAHTASAEYLFFGFHGHGMLVPYIWSGLAMGMVAMVIFVVPSLREHPVLSRVGAVLCIVGVWIEKGMGLIIPGFFPSQSGDLVEYGPSWTEGLVCLGIWSLGALLFTLFVRVASAIQQGELRAEGADRSPSIPASPPAPAE